MYDEYLNRQIRVEKIIGTVKCVATCGAIEIQPVEMWNSSASQISFLIYSAGADIYTVSCYLAAAIKLPKRKKTLNNFIVDLHNIIQFVR